MEKRNGKQSVQDVYNRLINCMEILNEAVGSVEKFENKQHIEHTLGAVDHAIEMANHALANYKD